MMGDKGAQDATGKADGIGDLDIVLGFASGAAHRGSPFRGANDKDEGGSDEERRAEFGPIRLLGVAADCRAPSERLRPDPAGRRAQVDLRGPVLPQFPAKRAGNRDRLRWDGIGVRGSDRRAALTADDRDTNGEPGQAWSESRRTKGEEQDYGPAFE